MRVEVSLMLMLFLSFIPCSQTDMAFGSEQEIGLSQAIDFALKQNREIRKTLLSLESSGLEVERANFEFMFNITPRINTEATGDSSSSSYGLDVSRKTILGTQGKVGIHSSVDRFSGSPDIHRNSVVAEVSQPILRRIGRLINEEPIIQAANSMKTARRYFEIQKTDLIVEVVSKHEELLMLQRQIEYEQKAIERLTRLNRLTQVREKQGRVTHVDSLRSDLKLGNAQLQYNNTKEKLQSLQADYAEMLGFPASTEFKVLPSVLVTIEVTNLESAIKTALQNRLDYAQIIQDCEDAKRGVRIARRNMLPDLNMISRYEFKGVGETASEAKPDDNVWFVGFSLESDIPLRNERLALSEALIHNQLVELKIEEVKAAISRKVQQEILFYNRTQKQIGLAERNYQAAKDRAKLARRLFEMHKGDSFSVTDAEDELSQAEIQLLSVQA
ncbi:MAG: TolC family protein, partial [Kiritimatiellae bacterium]|nr:TolC family protein [Kiritimatiellia bacterium]